MSNATFLRVAFMALALFSPSKLSAERVVDDACQISFQLTDGFVGYQEGKTKPAILYCFVKHGDSAASPRIVLQVELMKGTFPSSQRLKASELPKVEGMTFALGEIVWKKIPLDRVRQTLRSPEGGELISYWCQLPTVPRAFQLLTIGPLDREAEVLSALTQVVDSFEGKVNPAK